MPRDRGMIFDMQTALRRSERLTPFRKGARPGEPASIAVTCGGSITTLLAVVLLVASTGCRPRGDPASAAVVVYCSVDEPFARELFAKLSANTGIAVEPVFDSEAGKTTGLVNRIIAEGDAGRPRADVFWSSEVFGTIRLARLGLLEPYRPAGTDDIPDEFHDPEWRWTGTALRLRVLAYNPQSVGAADLPVRWEDLGSPSFASQVAFANPLFGTTRGHLAAMIATDGEALATAFLAGLRDGGALIVDGNSAAVRAVIDGRRTFAATDSDDVRVAQRAGYSIAAHQPQFAAGGTLSIPFTVAAIRSGPGTREAVHRVVDYLVSAEVERMLAESASANIPVRQSVRDALGITWPERAAVSYQAVADQLDRADAIAREVLLR